MDGYKSLIDEKGLKRENLQDPEFDISETLLQVKEENGSTVTAATEIKRITELVYKK